MISLVITPHKDLSSQDRHRITFISVLLSSIRMRAGIETLISVCGMNKLMEMFLHIKQDMFLKNSICAQLRRCTSVSIVGYFNYIQLFSCGICEMDGGSKIIRLISVES